MVVILNEVKNLSSNTDRLEKQIVPSFARFAQDDRRRQRESRVVLFPSCITL